MPAPPTLINGYTAGMFMREAVRRAMLVIRKERFIFESKIKTVDYKRGDDLVTSADIKAQEIYLRLIKDNFPKAGIVAEEDFSCPCTDTDLHYFFTIDPLDGTKAFGRRQSEGIATMISLVIGDKVEGVCIGDVMTGEIYYTRPFSKNAYRISEYETSEKLEFDKKPLRDQFLLMRADPRSYSPLAQKMSWSGNGLIQRIEVTGGSIGLSFAKLWKGQVGAILVRGRLMQMPWDICPLIGISLKMGFRSYELRTTGIQERPLAVSEKPFMFEREMLVIHESNVPELLHWFKNHEQANG